MRTIYYKSKLSFLKNSSKYEVLINHDLKSLEDEFILVFDQNRIVGILEFKNLQDIIIKALDCLDKTQVSYLFSKLILINYLKKDLIVSKEIYYEYRDLFFKFSKPQELNQDFIKLNLQEYKNRRYVQVGELKTGNLNNLCDVPGVQVSHYSINRDNIQTGITAVFPHSRNIFKEKVLAASYVYNGFGKSIGLIQIDELGTLEVPILLTNTLNVGKVSDGLIQFTLDNNPEIGISLGTVNPVVLECNDGVLNEIRNRVLEKEHTIECLNNPKGDFSQGGIGAGSGMTCHGFKGGIGSASRIVNLGGIDYTLGIMVNSNFLGSTSKHLIFNQNHLGNLLNQTMNEENHGSIIIVIATDLPVNERQLKRLCKRAVLGIGRTGGFASNGSGDLVIGFSTANIIPQQAKESILKINRLADKSLDLVFQGVVEATEEAILNSLLYSKTTKGVRNNIAYSIQEKNEVFNSLLIENILGNE